MYKGKETLFFYGQTPPGILRKEFGRFVLWWKRGREGEEDPGMTEMEVARKVLECSNVERAELLRDFYRVRGGD